MSRHHHGRDDTGGANAACGWYGTLHSSTTQQLYVEAIASRHAAVVVSYHQQTNQQREIECGVGDLPTPNPSS